MQEWNSIIHFWICHGPGCCYWAPRSFKRTVNHIKLNTESHIKLNSSQVVLVGGKGFPENVWGRHKELLRKCVSTHSLKANNASLWSSKLYRKESLVLSDRDAAGWGIDSTLAVHCSQSLCAAPWALCWCLGMLGVLGCHPPPIPLPGW